MRVIIDGKLSYTRYLGFVLFWLLAMGFALGENLQAQLYNINGPTTADEGKEVVIEVSRADSSAPSEVIVEILPGSALPEEPGFLFYDYSPSPDARFSDTVFFKSVGQKISYDVNIRKDNQQEDDEDFTIRVVDAVKGFVLAEKSLIIPANDQAEGKIQSLPGEYEIPLPSLNSDFGEILIETENAPPVDRGWRFVGETEWREFGTPVPRMLIVQEKHKTPLAHEVEFLPVPGFTIENRVGSSSNPLGAQFVLEDQGDRLKLIIDYVPNKADEGGLSVQIFPDTAAKGSPPAKWRIRHNDMDGNGEDDDFLTGEILTLPAGFYEIYFEQVPGFEVPRPRTVQVVENQTNIIECTYLDIALAGDKDKASLTPIDYFETSFKLKGVQGTGQVRSNIAKATGVAVARRVVLTSAQVVFNPKRLTSSYKVRWSLQRQTKGVSSGYTYNPPPQIPRGWYLFNDYSALLGSQKPGEVSLDSADNSVAALFFAEPCARGGFTGYLGSTDGQKKAYLEDSEFVKFLAGYGLSQDTHPGAQSGNDGILYASPENFNLPLIPIDGTRLYRSIELSNQSHAALGSLLGAPLFLRNSKRPVDLPAAILVGSQDFGSGKEELIFRAIDVSVAALIHRGSYSAVTGNIYTNFGSASGSGSLQTLGGPGVFNISASAGLGGGFGGTGGGTFGDEATTGSLVIDLDPNGAVAAGARWGQSGVGDANLDSGDQIDGLFAGEYSNLIYSDATGYDSPNDTAYTIVSEQTTRDEKFYSAVSEEMSWIQSKFSEADQNNPDVSGPEANPDGDPYKNNVERALGGNPMASEDLLNLSASSGGLSIRIEPDTSQSDITLSIYVGSTPSSATRKGTVGAETNKGMTDWDTEGEGITIKNHGDGTWTIQDSNAGGARFMYIEATSSSP